MRAVIVRTPGGLEQLEIVEVPAPVPGASEVLIDVAFCGLNWADTMIRVGSYPHPLTYPTIPGLEVSGTVAAVGDGVTGARPGDRVIGFHEKGGGYAEQFVCAAAAVTPVPGAMSLETAAAFPVQALTAWHMLHTVGRIEPGQWVLVHAIGGGVGLWCTQLAVRAGARVIGTVGTPGKQSRPLELGATAVVLTSDEDFEPVVARLTGGGGVDLVIDSLGARTLDRSFEVVRKLGHVISIGEAEGLPYQNIRERLLPRSATFTRFHLGHVDLASRAWARGLDEVMGGLLDGSLHASIEQVFPLEQAREMHARIQSRQVSGKLLLAVPR
jgi:NADPH2:quinone reductase